MQSCVAEKAYKVLDVSQAYAGAHPRAVMVVHLYAIAANTAMERPGRSNYAACATAGENLNQVSICCVSFWTDLELFDVEVRCGSVLNRLRIVGHFIRSFVVDYLTAQLR